MRKKPSWLLETIQNEHKNYENVIYKSLNYTLNEDTQLIEQDFIDFISDLRIKGWVPFMFSDDILDDEFKKTFVHSTRRNALNRDSNINKVELF